MNKLPTMKLFCAFTLIACLFVGVTRCFASELDYHFDCNDRMREESKDWDNHCRADEASSRSERNDSTETYTDNDGRVQSYESGSAWA